MAMKNWLQWTCTQLTIKSLETDSIDHKNYWLLRDSTHDVSTIEFKFAAAHYIIKIDRCMC